MHANNISYNAVRGDLVDELVGAYVIKKKLSVPITRLGPGTYIFGRKHVQICTMND